MKVIYNTCIVDPWIKVAQKLKDEYGYEPVYWNGYNYDDSEIIVPKVFPGIIYHPFFEAWKGIFPKEISEHHAESYLNIDFLKWNAHYELQTYAMMNRFDFDRFSFNFMERQRHYLNLVKYWTACIEMFKPDLVINSVIPHRVYDFVLYRLCQFYNIKYISIQNTAFLERIFAVSNIFSIRNIFDNDYARFKEIPVQKQDLPADILNNYEKIKLDYSVAAPYYMKKHAAVDRQQSSFIGLMKSFSTEKKFNKLSFFGKNGMFTKGLSFYYKNRKHSIENSRYSLVKFIILKLKNNLYKRKLKKFYSSVTVNPDYNVPYIIYFLHYQPEATSSPSGDIFVNQRLCIETLLKHTPDNYKIYIKEHPAQFMSHLQGHSYRIKEFYKDLIAYHRVRLMPLDENPFTLINRSKAIATIIGTVGWEAIVQQKPVIAFGISWYEKYSGVLRITDEASASRITSFIDSYSYDENNLFAYLLAVDKNTIKAYHYHGRKEMMNLPEEECVNNIVKEVMRAANSE